MRLMFSLAFFFIHGSRGLALQAPAAPATVVPQMTVDLTRMKADQSTTVNAPANLPFTIRIASRPPAAAFRVVLDQAGAMVRGEIAPASASLPPTSETAEGCTTLRAAVQALLATGTVAEVPGRVATVTQRMNGSLCPAETAAAKEVIDRHTRPAIASNRRIPAGQELKVRIEQLDAGGSVTAAWALVVAASSSGPAWPYAHEEEWIASSIVRDIVDMATLGTSVASAPNVTVTRTVWEHPSSLQVEVRVPGSAPIVHQGTLEPHAWAPGAYAPIARAVVARVARKPSPSPIRDGALARLTDLRAATLVQESDRIGARLSSHPLDPHAHEEAALTFLAFALRERAGELSDVRHSLNRATAHLALAEALRGPTGESATSRIARIALDVLAGRQAPALAALEKAVSPSGPEGAWARALKLRIPEDWREVGAERGTLLERLHAYAAFKKSFDGPRALEYLRATEPEPIPDWGWIALESSTVSVEAGNTFGPALLHATLAELAAVLQRPPQVLSADGVAAAVDVTPGPAVRQGGSSRRIEVLDAATWGQFYGRHLLQAAQMGDNYFRKVVGLPERSNAFWVEVEKYLGRMELFPALHFAREQQLGRWKPAAGMPSESSLRSYCAPFVRRVSRAPETVVPSIWMVFFQACDKERASQSIPMTSRWFAAPALPGTAQAAATRINNIGVSLADPLTGLKALAPFDEGVVAHWRRRRGKETPADVAAAYGPRVDYSLPVLRRAAWVTEDPAAKRAWLDKACSISADECLDLGAVLASLGDDAAAAQAYEKAFRDARDRVKVSSRIEWLAEYYLAHGRAADAERVARDAAGVYSSSGLRLGGEILEKLGRVDEAEGLFRAIGERYGDPANDVANELRYFYVRAARRPGGERFAARSRQVVNELFPRGLERVTVGDLSGPPLDGAVIMTETRDSARLGVHKDDIMVALDGFRVHDAIQYRAVRAMSDDPRISVIVWDGRQYKQVQGSFPDRRFGSVFADYKPPAAKP